MSVEDRCRDALEAICHEAIEDLREKYPEERTLTIDWQDLAADEADADTLGIGADQITLEGDRLDEDEEFGLDDVQGIASDVIARPDTMVEAFEEALRTYPDDGAMSMATVAFENLPEDATFTVGGYSPSEWEERLFALEGQITKRTEVKPRVDEAAFECTRCGTTTRLPQPEFGDIREPHGCKGCESQQTFFRLIRAQSEFQDYQKIRLQQPPEDARGDTENIDVHLPETVAGEDRVESGGRVTIIGRHRPVWTGEVVFDECVLGNEVVPDEPTIEDYQEPAHQRAVEEIAAASDSLAELCDAFAPNFEAAGERDQQVIVSLVLQLLGGWTRETEDGAHHRGEPHIFLLGDPGVGKTVLLRAAYEIAPRAAYTDGTGSSAAGLTAAIEKDDFSDGQWSISAGTLVRAHEGVAIVDELDKGDTSDLDALHTALESQEVHVDKAGKNATLPAQTALLAAGNPTGGHFDPQKDFAEQVDFQSPLLSRFDLILRMQAREQRDLILRVAEKMVDARTAAGKLARGEELTEDEEVAVDSKWDTDQLAAYIAHAREKRPVVRDDDVKRRMTEYFADLKTSVPERYRDAMGEGEYDGPPLPITARKLDALQRFAEASARTRLDDTVRMDDVERVIPLIERSLGDIGIAPKDNSAFGTVGEDVDATSVGIGD